MGQRASSSSSSTSATGGNTDSWAARGLVAAGAAAAGAYVAFSLRRSSRFRSQVVGIIPARYASSRFQGKPLVPILCKPMIQAYKVFEKVTHSDAFVVQYRELGREQNSPPHWTNSFVATDDEKIAECCRGFGADVIMTSESCRNGTERCNEALQKLQKSFDVVVNIQGDEPLIEPEIIDGVVKALQAAPDAVFSTAVTSLKPEDASDPNRVKCVVDNHGYAIYFSRGLIPYNKSGKVNPHFPYLLHLGIQSYDAQFLRGYPKLSPTPLQLEEDLEQLKVLESGYKMKQSVKVHACVGGTSVREDQRILSSGVHVVVGTPGRVFDMLRRQSLRPVYIKMFVLDEADEMLSREVIKVDHDAHGVDTPQDVEKIESYMRERNLS
ncbi:unnamed protein product [Camellia sinensis]